MKVYHIWAHTLDPFHPELAGNPESFIGFRSSVHRFIDHLRMYDKKGEFEHTIVNLSRSTPRERTDLVHEDGYGLIVLRNSVAVPPFFPCELSLPLIRFVKGTRDGILHVHGTSSFIFDSMAPYLPGRPSCAHYRGGEFTWRSFPVSFPKYCVLAPLSLRAPHYLFIQNRIRLRKYAEWYRIPQEKMVYLPNCIEPEKFESTPEAAKAARTEMGIGPGAILVLFASRMVPNKGISELLEAFSRVRGRHPEAELVLVGDGSLESAVRERKAPGVHVLGRLDFKALPPLYNASDIFVLPTHYDSFPNSLLEAMACGLPCISTKADGPSDMIEDGKEGLLAAIGSARQLEERLEMLVSDAALRRRLGAAAKAKVVRDYLWEGNVQKVFGVYRNLGAKFKL